jgi:hypothetical protein
MEEIDWTNENSFKLVIKLRAEKKDSDLEMGKPYFAIVNKISRYEKDKRRIHILAQNDFNYTNDKTYQFNSEIQHNAMDFNAQFEILWHEGQRPHNFVRPNFKVGDTILFTGGDMQTVPACLGRALTPDEANDSTFYKNYLAFPEPKLMISSVYKDQPGKVTLIVTNPNAGIDKKKEFSIKWDEFCWGDKYEIIPAESISESSSGGNKKKHLKKSRRRLIKKGKKISRKRK